MESQTKYSRFTGKNNIYYMPGQVVDIELIAFQEGNSCITVIVTKKPRYKKMKLFYLHVHSRKYKKLFLVKRVRLSITIG